MGRANLSPRVVRPVYSKYFFSWCLCVETEHKTNESPSSMIQCPQYTASKYGVVGLCRASGPVFVKEGITVNAICPAFIPTNLCPPEVAKRWPKEHITPLSTVNKAIDAFLADDTLTGQAVELSQENIYFRQPVDYPNDSQRWIGEESDKIWNLGYQEPPKRQGY